MSEESQPPTGGIRPDLWSRTYQIGVVVRDITQAAAFYERLGIGPFEEGPSAHTLVRRIYGKDAPDVAVKGLIAQMGNIEFELLQPVAGKGIQAEFLERHGEGVVHLCAYTDDIDRDYAALLNAEITCFPPPVALEMGPGLPSDLRALFFLDPDGTCVELIESPRTDQST